MSETFVPLTTRGISISAGRTGSVFRPMAPANAGGGGPGPAAAAAGRRGEGLRASDHPAHAPRVSLVREGDRVTRIRVECVCGEVIELECE